MSESGRQQAGYMLDMVLYSGAAVWIEYEDLESATKACASIAEKLRKAPNDRAGCFVAAREVPTPDGVEARPMAAVDFRDIAFVKVAPRWQGVIVAGARERGEGES